MDATRRANIAAGKRRYAASIAHLRIGQFWNLVEKGPDCWTWHGGINGSGYGQFSLNAHFAGAHRLAYELTNGAIPHGMQIDHLCRNKLCVNPSHLEVVTSRINVLRSANGAAINAVKTHCPRGHEYTSENTRIYKGGRLCRSCERERSTRRRANGEWASWLRNRATTRG